MPNAGCKDCTDRHLGCHSNCQKYLEFKKRHEELREKKKAEHQKNLSRKHRYSWYINRVWR